MRLKDYHSLKYFSASLQSRLISAGLESVLIHTENLVWHRITENFLRKSKNKILISAESNSNIF